MIHCTLELKYPTGRRIRPLFAFVLVHKDLSFPAYHYKLPFTVLNLNIFRTHPQPSSLLCFIMLATSEIYANRMRRTEEAQATVTEQLENFEDYLR